MTFSVVAWDPKAQPAPEWGVAVASKFLAVGAVVPSARADVGAIATQAFANLSHPAAAMEQLARGDDAGAVVDSLTKDDPEREKRQVGVVDGAGRTSAFTGSECFDWAGHHIGDGYCCQGNVLAGEGVIRAMAATFEVAGGDLAERLIETLHAGDAAGGDRRGRQSASLLVVRRGGGYGGATDVAVDLRVDDHPKPLPELGRLLDLHRLVFPRPGDLEFMPLSRKLAEEVRLSLDAIGYPVPAHDVGAVKKSLFEFVGTENLDERWSDDDVIERGVLEALRRAASKRREEPL